MTWLEAVILAAIQGLTEFLPVSSSGHLVLPKVLLGWQDQGLAFDVAVHVGSLLAVLWYFRRDVASLLAAWWANVLRRPVSAEVAEEGRLAWLVILATIPAGVSGVLLGDFIEANLRTAAVLATTTIVFGVVLYVADRLGKGTASTLDLGWRGALFIGFAQVLALIPGTSRSGITMSAALLLGLSRTSAAKFSFFLSMPIILAAGGFKALDLIGGQAEVDWPIMALGVAVSCASAFLCIYAFMRLIERIGMLPFAIYRVALGVLIIGVAL